MELEALLQNQSYVEREMLDVALDYWFNDQEDRRSPFPDYIKSDLRVTAVTIFLKWTGKLTDESKKEINDEILIERFEEILFEEAYKMVISDDEKLTIKYPFMLRIGDIVKDKNRPESTVMKRELTKNGDMAYLKVTLQENGSEKTWETSFELPE